MINGVEEIVRENWERGASKDMILMDQLAALNGSLLGLDEALGDSNAQLQSSIDEQGCVSMGIPKLRLLLFKSIKVNFIHPM